MVRSGYYRSPITLAAAVAAALLGGLLALGLAGTKPAGAAFPGTNGKIVYEQSGNIYSVDPSGRNRTQLTDEGASYPAVSADGKKIVFVSMRDGNNEIYVMDADGNNETRLTNNTAYEFDPQFSPGGTKIVFVSQRDSNNEIYVMDADGTDQTRLTEDGANDVEPTYSPNGTKIAFAKQGDIYVMNADGSEPVNLTNSSAQEYNPDYSPDGTKIVFSSDWTTIRTMNSSDGTNQTPIPNLQGDLNDPVYSPDGKKVAFQDGTSNAVIYTINTNGKGKKVALTDENVGSRNPSWGPLPKKTR